MNPIIMLSGKMGSGKTTLSNSLVTELYKTGKYPLGHGVVSLKFADPLYAMHNAVRDVADRYSIDFPRKNGTLLQWLGTDLFRKDNPNVWVNIFVSRARKAASESAVIVDDMRFQNEFHCLPEAVKIRLTAPKDARKARADVWRDNDTHQSETDLDEYEAQGKFDLTIDTAKHNAQETLSIVLNYLKL